MKKSIKLISIIMTLVIVTSMHTLLVQFVNAEKIEIGSNIESDKYIEDIPFDVDDYEFISDSNNSLKNTITTFSTVNFDQEEVQPQEFVTARATRVYDIELPSNRGMVIQKCYVGTSYLYTTQCANDSTDIYISRCKINGKKAIYVGSMTLKNFGHNQILEFYSHNNKTYVWVGCRPNPDAFEDGNGQKYYPHYTTMIGRIQYKPRTTISSYFKIGTIGALNCGNTSGRPFEVLRAEDREKYSHVIKRIDAAMSSDKSQIVIATWSIYGNIQYSYFDNEVLNDILDEVEDSDSKNISCLGNKTIQNACTFSCVQKYGSRVLPNKSCQGIDLTNAGSIYISGGKGEKSSKGYVMYPKIGKMVMNSFGGYTYTRCVKLLNTIETERPEIEGVQIKGDLLYFVLDTKTAGTNHYLFSLDKNLLSS